MTRINQNRPLTTEDHLSVAEFADLFGFPAEAILSALERNCSAISKPFYSIPDLARRWCCSRASVYAILRESEFKLLDMRQRKKAKGKWNVPRAVVEQIEKSRMRSMPEKAEVAA
jgi:hypothetical protein